jgi:hypothetical protein
VADTAITPWIIWCLAHHLKFLCMLEQESNWAAIDRNFKHWKICEWLKVIESDQTQNEMMQRKEKWI